MSTPKKSRIYAWNEARPCPGRTKPANGRRATAVASAGVLQPANDGTAPPRHERRRAWALVPRPVRETAPDKRLDWLPPRTRALLNRTIALRNALDRTLAVSKGLAPDSPKCARFAGEKYREALDRQVRANAAKQAGA